MDNAINLEGAWKDIIGYEGFYWVNCLGFIRSKRKILKPMPDKDGYLQVFLSLNGKVKTCKIHILVWDHFGSELRNGKTVDHKKNNKLLNGIIDLQLLTAYENKMKYYQERIRTSGLPMGVKQRGAKFEASLGKGKTYKYLGCFNTPEEASTQYEKQRMEIYGN